MVCSFVIYLSPVYLAIREREFAGLIEPGQRIRHLKRMLSDLGMKNNYSIQAARAIKHERDLARELSMWLATFPAVLDLLSSILRGRYRV